MRMCRKKVVAIGRLGSKDLVPLDTILVRIMIAEEAQRYRRKEVIIRKIQGECGMWIIRSNHFSN
jgi:hypothetical protein